MLNVSRPTFKSASELSVGRWAAGVGRLLPLNDRRALSPALLRWYRKHGRDLPWRKTRDPYRVLVSEVMLQQTQVATVVPYYTAWLRRFPDFAALARASESEVLHAWQGLGYYARARNLRETARIIEDRHHGRFPSRIADMKQLPGIGRYIAHAVATFAFEQPVPVVEANTARVLSRLFDLRLPIDQTRGRDALWRAAASLVPKRTARIFNSALMDLGALVCAPRPRCSICPAKRFCRASAPATLPLKKPRPRTESLVERHLLIRRFNRVLLAPAQRRWHGMWILPSLNGDRSKWSSPRRAPIYKEVFPFTHHRVTLTVFRSRRQTRQRHEHWFSAAELAALPIPSPHRRALNSLLNEHARAFKKIDK